MWGRFQPYLVLTGKFTTNSSIHQAHPFIISYLCWVWVDSTLKARSETEEGNLWMQGTVVKSTSYYLYPAKDFLSDLGTNFFASSL